MTHEYPKCKQINMKPLHPRAFYLTHITDKTFTDYTMSDEVDGNIKEERMNGIRGTTALLSPPNLNVSVLNNPPSRDWLDGTCRSLLHIMVHVV